MSHFTWAVRTVTYQKKIMLRNFVVHQNVATIFLCLYTNRPGINPLQFNQHMLADTFLYDTAELGNKLKFLAYNIISQSKVINLPISSLLKALRPPEMSLGDGGKTHTKSWLPKTWLHIFGPVTYIFSRGGGVSYFTL